MPTISYRKPRLATNYYLLFEPPDAKGDEVLHFVSESRRLTLKGRSFREFMNTIVPLLDGRHTVDEIVAAGAEDFPADELAAALALLDEQHLIAEGEDERLPPERAARLEPQLNLLRAFGADAAHVQERMARASVTIFGAAGAGAAVALGLAAAGTGRLRVCDPSPVSAADPYLSPAFAVADVGASRAQALARRLAAVAPGVVVSAEDGPLDRDDQVTAAAAGADFIVCCLDPGRASLAYKLNRACLASRTPWIVADAAAMEVLVGPLMHPYETACYLCYKMRIVACAENPEDEFAIQNMLDRRRHDDSATREGLVFGAATAGQLAALEALKAVSGVLEPATVGRLVVLDLASLSTTKHHVLRKPWCPACQGGDA